ncbi:MAG: non-ribosomal peptide synthetase [Pseudanabaena frigida]|uniref:Non-ribosomal peptide synthetase n=1 Tax=Pseudanabaena frigida TaxID=945775 RepID=A0A2W4Y6L8_9CYAN|nr:MAG: non-ribosomal peptide synthetase [Pseudanabaena frigida]
MKDKHQEQNQSDSSRLFHPLSEGQEEFWFLSQIDPPSRSYNIYSSVKIRTVLDITAWYQAWKELFDRHSILRTTYTTIDGNLVQQIHAHLDAPIFIIDTKDWNEEYLQSQIFVESDRLFNLTQGPVIRICLFQRSLYESIQLITMHHIAGDIWSFDILLRELQSLYSWQIQKNDSDRATQELKLLPDILSYSDFVNWQSQMLGGSQGKQLQEYWEHQLHGELPMVDLPFQKQSFSSRAVNCNSYIDIDLNLAERLKRFARDNTVSLYKVMLTAFTILIYRYVGCEEVLIGSPMAGRFGLERFKDIVGLFANIVVLRTNLADNPTFRELLARADRIVSSAQLHQDYPFSHLIRQLQNSSDLDNYEPIKVIFNWQKTTWRQINNALKMEFMSIGHQGCLPFSLFLNIMESDDRLQANWQFDPKLFDERSIDAMAEHYQNLLESILSDPDLPISRLSLLNETERHKLVVEWNQTNAYYPDNLCIHHLFEQQVLRTPDAIAVVCKNNQLTYESLNQQANQVAHYLRKVCQSMGCDRVAIVGILMERSIEMIVGVLGILKAGGAYLPLDPSYPQERLVYMLSDSKTPILLTQQKLVKSLSQQRIHRVCIEDALMTAEQENIIGINVTAQDLAYVIYTSGSTGKPKGVKVRHQGLVNVMFDRITNISEPESLKFVALTASLSFDGSASQIFAPFLVGGTSVIVENLFALPTCPQFQQITSIGTTPSIIDKFIDDFPLPDSLLTLILGGESVSKSLLEKLTTHTNVPKVINVYGPTEATVYCTVAVLLDRSKHKMEEPNIGRPIANTSIYILDSELQPLPVCIAGEVYIGGAGVAQGYLNQPQLTSEKFIVNPFCAESFASAHSHIHSSHLYKTGDLARYLPDGNIEFLGRIDRQVKIRGFRIELGEIETILKQHPDVRETVIIVREDIPDDKRLVAYIVPQCISQEEQIKTHDLRSFLQQHLPNYMIPNAFVFLESLPLNPNGKINRRALDFLTSSGISLDREFTPPSNSIERVLANIWSDILDVPQVGIHDNFFDLGGHSLLSVRLVSEIEKAFDYQFPLKSLFQINTIAEIAKSIGQRAPENILVEDITLGLSLEDYRALLAHSAGKSGIRLGKRGLIINIQTESQVSSQPFVWIGEVKTGKNLKLNQPLYVMPGASLSASMNSHQNYICIIASLLVDELLTLQPSSSYSLGGWCYNGLVAMEMAQQLTRLSKKVDLVTLIDVPGRSAMYKLCRELNLYLGTIRFHLLNLSTLSFKDKCNYLFQRIKLGNIDDKPEQEQNIDLMLIKAFQEYTPNAYTGNVLFIDGSQQIVHGLRNIKYIDLSWLFPYNGWGNLLKGEVYASKIPCDHLDLMEEPYSVEVGKIISSHERV